MKGDYNLQSIINEIDCNWIEPEWGFPKGRHNYQEKDLLCAFREFEEETGYSRTSLNLIQNISPFEEIFTGSNYKSYKHKYFFEFFKVFYHFFTQYINIVSIAAIKTLKTYFVNASIKAVDQSIPVANTHVN